MWPYTKSGPYTVKSGYLFLESEQNLYPIEVAELNKVKKSL